MQTHAEGRRHERTAETVDRVGTEGHRRRRRRRRTTRFKSASSFTWWSARVQVSRFFFLIFFKLIFTTGLFYYRFYGSNGALEPCASPRKHGPMNGKDRIIDGAVETAGEGGDEPEIVYLSAA